MLTEVVGVCLSVLTLRMMSGVEKRAGPNASARWAGGLRFSRLGYLVRELAGVTPVAALVVLTGGAVGDITTADNAAGLI